MSYFEMDTTCERCGLTLVFVGSGKKGAKKAARSHGWHFAVADMAICPDCQKPKDEKRHAKTSPSDDHDPAAPAPSGRQDGRAGSGQGR